MIPLVLGGERFDVHVPSGPTERRLRRALARFVAPRSPSSKGSATAVRRSTRVLHLDLERLERLGPVTFTQVIAQVFRLAAAALHPEVLFFHAAAIGGPSGAALFVAPSGAGKTTLAVVAARLGLDVLADDVALVRVVDRVVLPGPVRLRHREAMARLVTPPRRFPPPGRAAPLTRVFLLASAQTSTSEILGTEALLSELPASARWDAACRIADLLDHVELRRLAPLDLSNEAGAARAREALTPVFVELGASPSRVQRLFSRCPRASKAIFSEGGLLTGSCGYGSE